MEYLCACVPLQRACVLWPADSPKEPAGNNKNTLQKVCGGFLISYNLLPEPSINDELIYKSSSDFVIMHSRHIYVH